MRHILLSVALWSHQPVVLCVFLDANGKAPSVTETGAWSITKDYRYRLDTAMAHAIVQLITSSAAHSEPRRTPTAIDMGAGVGMYVRFLRNASIAAEGLEGALNAEDMSAGVVHHADLTQPLKPCRRYDWVLNLEVAEHIPQEFEPTLLHNLDCSVRHGMVVSWGAPGQGGVGHVNLRSKEYVRQALAPRGLVHDANASASLVREAKLPWFKHNVQVFRRSLDRSEARASS